MKFYRKLLTAAALLSCLYASRAQAQTTGSPFEDEERTFWGGIAAGVNFSQVDGDGFAGYNKVGLNAGPVVYARLAPAFSMSLEFSLTQKGSKMRRISESVYTGQIVEMYDMKLNYVEVPLLFHFMPPGRFHYSLGGAYAYLLSAKESAVTVAPVHLDPNLYPFRSQDISITGGASYHIYKHWYLTGRFAYSLATIRDPGYIPIGYGGGGGGQRNNLFTFRLLYLF